MDNYASPSRALQASIIDSMLSKPKCAQDLVDEGVAANRTIRAAISYLKEAELIVEDHRGDYGRSYYTPVAKRSEIENGIKPTVLKFGIRGYQFPLAALFGDTPNGDGAFVSEGSPLMPLKWILFLRAAKSASRVPLPLPAETDAQVEEINGKPIERIATASTFSMAGAYGTFQEGMLYLEKSLQEALEMVQRLKNTPILWAPDDGYLWEMMGVVRTDNNILSLITQVEWIKPVFEKWLKEMRHRYPTLKNPVEGNEDSP
ncbi:MAG: hypothetical protein M3Z24_11275 [Chloroflexota bacterium]|nr:hypothetical protein [Chloroflexota bacterium]